MVDLRLALAAAMFAAFLAVAPGAGAQTAPEPADAAYWQSIQASNTAAEYLSYIETFPNGAFVTLARARLARLQEQGSTPAPIAIPGLSGAGATPAPAR